MALDILNIQPYKVSRSLRGYSVFMYGGWKTGKTTTACKFEKPLLIAAEKGYSAIPGCIPAPVNRWSEFKDVLRQLKTDEAKERYYNIILDTADILYDFCTKYICANNDADTVSDIPFGKGYGMIEKEFDEALRSIVQMGYGLVIISHEADKTFTDESGKQFNKIVPTLDKRANNIVARMADIIMYTRSIPGEGGTEKVMAFCRGTSRYEAGSRFKYFPEYFELSYKNLVNAIGEAIDKQEQEEGTDYFTSEVQNAYADTSSELDYDALMKDFSDIVANIPGSTDAQLETEDGKKFKEYWQPRITQTIERFLGKGKKMKDATRDQVEAISLVVNELKSMVIKK